MPQPSLVGSSNPITINVRLSGAVVSQGDSYYYNNVLYIVDYYDPETGDLVLIQPTGD